MKKLLQSLLILLFVASAAMAQERTITGTVTAKEDGLPIPGASVKVKGTDVGVSTGSNGSFSFKVPAKATILQISSIGFLTQEIVIGSKTNFNISLQNDSKILSEVVVTGYGIQTKLSNTGAQSSVKGEVFANVPNGNLANTLQGKAPGLMVLGNSGKPGDAPFLRVRGTNSLTAGNAPLIIIDGIDAPNLASINSNDIENVTLLKDPSSTAIYGSRAANGVLLITTRKGTSGEPKLTYSFQYGERKRNTDNFDLMNIDEKLKYEYDLGYQNREITREFQRNTSFPTTGSVGTRLFTLNDSERQRMYDILKSRENDWGDILFRTGKVKEHQLGLSGVSDKINYYINFNRYAEDGIAAYGSSFKRTGGRINVEYNAKKWLKLGTNLNTSYTQDQSVRESYNVLSPFGSYYFINSYEPLIDPTTGTYNGTNQGLNPIQSILDAPAKSNTLYSTGRVFADLTPIKDLIVKTSLGATYSKNAGGTFYVPGSPVDQAIFGTTAPGYKNDFGSENFFYIWSNTASYSKKLDQNHELSGLIGFEFLESQASSYQFNSKGYPSKDPKYDTQNNGATPNSVTSAKSDWAQVSYFGKLGYNFRQKYFVDASLRRDGSSRFGVNNRYGTFWSTGLAWNVIAEDFTKNNLGAWFNELKLRASVGKTGNNQIGNYDSQGVFGFGKYNGQSIIAETGLGNSKLSWETNFSYNLGLDFSTFNGRLRGTLEYYDKKTSDLLYRVPKPSTVGFTSRLENVGEMKNKGYEITLDGDVIRNKDVRWSLSWNLSHNSNKLTKIYGDVKEIPGSYTTLRVGQPINTFFLTRWAGIDPQTGAEQWYDLTGNKFSTFSSTGANKAMLEGKSAQPKYFGTFGTSVAYKGLELTASLYYNFGNYIYNVPWRDLVNNGNDPSTPQAAAALNYWKKPGDIVNYAKPVLGQPQPDAIDKYLQKGDYLRLRDVMLSYSLPKSLISKAKIQNVRLFLQGTNLWTWAKEYKGDPEVGTGNNERSDQPGVLSVYPYTPSKAYTFGINLTL